MEIKYCEHTGAILAVEPASNGCQECLNRGDSWVHLRLCASCGYVGCCDSSMNKHATAHYRATRHPIIRSFELGEEWGYCYVDDMFYPNLPEPGA